MFSSRMHDARSLTTASGISVAVRDLLDRAQCSLPFEGSVEVEVFAETPMGFAYPAMLALYAGSDWQALVHTYASDERRLARADDGHVPRGRVKLDDPRLFGVSVVPRHPQR